MVGGSRFGGAGEILERIAAAESGIQSKPFLREGWSGEADTGVQGRCKDGDAPKRGEL